MEDEAAEEENPTIEDKLDQILAQQDQILTELSTERALDSDLKRLVKIVLYLFILALVFYMVRSLLTPIISLM
jgi:nitrate/nitrite-specific signal transduction histidine kinase